jgi:transcription factor Dp-1
MAMDIISKDKKEIQWKGLPQTSISDVEKLKVLLSLSLFFFLLSAVAY